MKPTVISLFAGCGGSSLGYKWAGCKELLAVDFDKNSCETFGMNFPDVPVWRRDVKTVTGREIMKFCGIEAGELDILDGSPPCQGFSTAGKRIVMDERNDLFREFVRLVKELQPKVFVMENVSGMVKGKMRGRFKEIMLSLKSTGYNVKCKLLNSANYGVPQSRQRLFFIGVRSDVGIPEFPEPIGKITTAGEALKGVVNDEAEVKWLSDIKDQYIYPTLLKMRPGESFAKYENQGYNFVRVNPRRPAATLTKTLWGKASTNGQVHPTEHRKLTINEAKRLCSFPDDFKLVGTYREKWGRLGNAVMPKQAAAIVKTLKKEILDKHYSKQKSVEVSL